jgi:hypothetical protein
MNWTLATEGETPAPPATKGSQNTALLWFCGESGMCHPAKQRNVADDKLLPAGKRKKEWRGISRHVPRHSTF